MTKAFNLFYIYDNIMMFPSEQRMKILYEIAKNNPQYFNVIEPEEKNGILIYNITPTEKLKEELLKEIKF